MANELKHFKNCLAATLQADYPIHSRIHSLKSFHFPHIKCYVKRDDELGFGISGSKIRKYRTLIPFLVSNQIQEVVVIGSAYSNHVLSFTQLLIENSIQPTLFLRGNPHLELQGNVLLTSLFIPPESIHWFSKEDWKNVQAHANAYAKQQTHETFVLPEGGFCSQALPGAFTLALDILKNEEEMGIIFDHIFIEAGTGFTASALILALSWLKHQACIHVVLLAGDQQTFLTSLKSCQEMFHLFIQSSIPFPQNFMLHDPQITQSFGKTSSFLFKKISQIAQQEGFLTDPIYTVKLFIESEHLLEQVAMRGHACILHAGGALTLMGFQHQLQKLKISCL